MESFEEEQAPIKRRQLIAQQLMQQGAQPLETNQTAGGYVVPVSGLSALAKIGQQLSGAYIAKQADKRGAELQDQRLAELGGIDFSAPDAPSKLMKLGMVAEAIKLKSEGNKVHREGIPAGFNPADGGGIAPMPMAGGGDYADFLLKQAGAKAQIPGYGEPERLQIAQESQDMARQHLQLSEQAAARQEQAAYRQMDRDERLSNVESKKNDLQAWRLENPNYEKYQAEISDAESNYERLSKSIEAYKELLGKYSMTERHNPMSNSEIQSSYQAVTWPLRSESMINTGVLNPGDIRSLDAAVADPTAWNARGFRDNAELTKQLNNILNTARANVDAIRSKKSPKTPPPGTSNMPVSGGNINVDIANPENLSADDRNALQADIAKEQAKATGGLTKEEQTELDQLRARFKK